MTQELFVIEPVVPVVNVLHSHRLKHGQFCEFLSAIGTDYPNFLGHTAVWWLSRDKFHCDYLSTGPRMKLVKAGGTTFIHCC